MNGLYSGSDAEPGGLGEGGEEGRKRSQPGEARESGDADHRRYQDHPVDARELLLVEGVQSVHHGERAAGRIPDQMQRPRRTDAAARLPDRQSRCRQPVLPMNAGQGAGDGAVAGQPDGDRDVTGVAISRRDVTKAVGRVRQPVQQNDRPRRSRGWLHYVGAVPVLGEVAGIDSAALEVAIELRPFFRADVPGYISPHIGEDFCLGLHVVGPTRAVEFAGAELPRHVGMPRLQRRPTLRSRRTRIVSRARKLTQRRTVAHAKPLRKRLRLRALSIGRLASTCQRHRETLLLLQGSAPAFGSALAPPPSCLRRVSFAGRSGG